MGQRSQIFISFDRGIRDYRGRIAKPAGEILIARYYRWNFGSRMVSRAVSIIRYLHSMDREESLPGTKNDLAENTEKIIRFADLNPDLHDVQISTDLIKESREFYPAEARLQIKYIFRDQDNNDGKLFIRVEDDGTIQYAFTDGINWKPMSAEEYITMDGTDYDDEEREGSNLSANIQYLRDNAVLMTERDLATFSNRDFVNIYRKI